jgi:hypothetical protein
VTLTASANQTTAPDGTATADKLIVDNAAVNGHLRQAPTLTATGSMVGSIRAKAGEWSFIGIVADAMNKGITVNLSNGTFGANIVGAPDAYEITSLGNGWYEIKITVAAVTSGCQWRIYPCKSAVYTDGLGDGTSGVYVWGADVRTSEDAALNQPDYQRVNTSTDYDTSGFIHYLRFDGSDDSLSTAAIDFSAVNKMTVWTGVTKLSDAAVTIVAEITASATANDGGFFVAAPSVTLAANFSFLTRGTVAASNQILTTYAAPVTKMLTCQFDNAGATINDQVKPRVNGVLEQEGSTLGPTSAGNFANTALNIGRRAGASLPFNGRMTSLTVRGSATAASTEFIAAMEQYAADLAGQTFAST